MDSAKIAANVLGDRRLVPKQECPGGYKWTSVGMIPEEWSIETLGKIAVIATGNTPPTHDLANYGTEYPFVSPIDIGEEKYIAKTEKMLSKKGFAITRRFPADSILFVSIGSTIGKCGIAPIELTSNQQINAVIPSPHFSVDYIYYAICLAVPRIKLLAGEQAVPIVNKTQFSKTLVALPSRSEQHTIATALSDVDELLDALEALIAKKRAVKQAAMQQLLTGRIRLPGFNGEWERKTFAELFVRLNGKAHQIQTSEYRTYGRHPVVDQSASTVAAFSDRSDRLFSCPSSGVIVFGDHTCVFKFIDFDFLVGADGTQLLDVQGWNVTRFFFYQLLTKDVQNTGYNRHFKLLLDLTFTVPSQSEQTAIAAVLSDMDAEVAVLERRLDKVREVKQGMMQQLLTGRVRLV